MKEIDNQAYLEYSFRFKCIENDIRDELCEWLPDIIIDAHAHCNLEEHIIRIDPTVFNHMGSTFPWFSMEESGQLHQFLFPGKKLGTLRFAMPYPDIDYMAANDYLFGKADQYNRVALYVPPDAIKYAREMLTHQKVSALKMYYKAVVPWAKTIYEYFPPAVLEVAEQENIPIVLNLPTMITKSRDQLQRLVEDFPRLRIAVAHLGSSKFMIEGLAESFEQFAQYPQIFMDTAMNPSLEVVKLAIDYFGPERIMYGSDEPICLVRSKPYIHPTLGQRLITEYPYHWVDPIEHDEYKHLAGDTIHAIWQSLLAVKGAIEAFPRDQQEYVKNRVFYQNACDFYGF